MDDATPERWLEVLGYEGLYEVSEPGRVKSLPRNTTRGGILKQVLRPDGYRTVRLYKDGASRSHLVHVLVAEAVFGPRPAGMDVRHIDGDRANNAAWNLAYGSRSENVRDMLGHGRGQIAKTHCPYGHPYDEVNTYIRPDGGRECQTCRERRRQAWASGERGRKGRKQSAGASARKPDPDLPGEEWRPAVGAEGFYEVSDLGRVRSVPHMTVKGLRGGRILSPCRVAKLGYLSVGLSVNGVVRYSSVHRLVAAAFHGPCPDGQEVRHLDGDPANNAAANLRYGTKSENRDDQRRHGTHPFGGRETCSKGHPWTEENTIRRYWPDGRFKQRVCRVCLEGWVATSRQRRREAS